MIYADDRFLLRLRYYGEMPEVRYNRAAMGHSVFPSGLCDSISDLLSAVKIWQAC